MPGSRSSLTNKRPPGSRKEFHDGFMVCPSGGSVPGRSSEAGTSIRYVFGTAFILPARKEELLRSVNDPANLEQSSNRGGSQDLKHKGTGSRIDVGKGVGGGGYPHQKPSQNAHRWPHDRPAFLLQISFDMEVRQTRNLNWKGTGNHCRPVLAR